MNAKRVRTLLPLLVLFAVGIGLVLNAGTGTLSALGWRDISLLCPLGALGSMLAAKTIFPRALISLALGVALIVLLGRAFCSWICPVPFVSGLRNAFKKKPSVDKEAAGDDESKAESKTQAVLPAESLTAEEQVLLKTSTKGCAACSKKHTSVDSRHLVLGGALLSAVIFGFPVFCLICPIGLTFASILLVISLFGSGDVTWSVIAVPALLLVEVVFFRKWCSKICPLSAFMSLVAKANRTFRPTIDKKLCLEATTDVACGKCTNACEQRINLRKLGLGAARSECTRCRSCMGACPVHAISMPLIAPGSVKRVSKK